MTAPVAGVAAISPGKGIAARAKRRDLYASPIDVGGQETKQTLDMLLLTERLMIAFYYAGLTTSPVVRDARLCGPSGDPNNPEFPPSGNPAQVRYLQAALDAEVKHDEALVRLGATSPIDAFYLPSGALTRLGTTVSLNSFLGMLEALETICIGAYSTATLAFVQVERFDLAAQSAACMGVESEHRTLGRVVTGIRPANSHTLETGPFATVGDIVTALQPFLTGRRFLYAAGAPLRVKLPSKAQASVNRVPQA